MGRFRDHFSWCGYHRTQGFVLSASYGQIVLLVLMSELEIEHSSRGLDGGIRLVGFEVSRTVDVP